ncbi:MAG: Ig-like domain-containing protein [Planctomycetota bacterium]|nr:Ig-like domain-containing protein [Planctomycetota bacterium]
MGYGWAIGTTPGGTDVQPFWGTPEIDKESNHSLLLTPGMTYYVTVRAYNGHGLTTEVTSDGVTIDTTPPPVPAGLVAQPGNTIVTLVWNDVPNDTVAGYNVYMNANGWMKINLTLVPPGPPSPSYTATGLTNGVQYFFAVTAVDLAGNEGPFSAAVSATPGVTLPAPAYLHMAQASSVQVVLNWMPVDFPGIAGYKVYRSETAGGPYTQISPGLLANTTYTDLNVIASTFYYYVVRAQDSAGHESPNSNEVAAYPKDLAAPIITFPSGPKKTNDATPTVAGTVAPPEFPGMTTNIFVYANGVAVCTAMATDENTWSVGSANYSLPLSDGTYAFTARARDSYGNISPLSFSVTIAVDMVPPAAPTGLSALGMSNAVHLQWLPNTDLDLLGYNVYRKAPNESEFVKLNELPVVGTQYRDDGVVNGSQYRYRITAVDNAVNESD